MPRVTEEHRDRRRQQILQAATRRFAINGFHATSMQDVVTESGLSAGSVYRYFSSKYALIEAIADQSLGLVSARLVDALQRENPPTLDEVLLELLRTLRELDEVEVRVRVVVQIWGEALRNPTVHELLTRRLRELFGLLTSVVERLQRDGTLPGWVPADLEASVLARSVVSLLPGFLLQRAVFEDFDLVAHGEVMAAMLRGGSGTAPSVPE